MSDKNVETLSGTVVQGEDESDVDYRKRRELESKRTTEYLRRRNIWKGLKKS